MVYENCETVTRCRDLTVIGRPVIRVKQEEVGETDRIKIGELWTRAMDYLWRTQGTIIRAILEATKIYPHPNLIRFFDMYRVPGGDEYYMYYYCIESIGTIEDWLKFNSFFTMPINSKIQLLGGLCSAVSHLHKYKLVHRDIKPANIWVVPDDQIGVKLMLGDYKTVEIIGQNFGVEKIGTEGFVPIEIYRNGTIANPRSDIFSLAATIAFLLSDGRFGYPIRFGYLQELEFINKFELSGMCNEIVINVLKKAMSENIDERYATVDEFWFELRQALESLE